MSMHLSFLFHEFRREKRGQKDKLENNSRSIPALSNLIVHRRWIFLFFRLNSITLRCKLPNYASHKLARGSYPTEDFIILELFWRILCSSKTSMDGCPGSGIVKTFGHCGRSFFFCIKDWFDLTSFNLTFLFSFPAGNNLKCFECNSHTDPDCSDPFNWSLPLPPVKLCDGCCVKMVQGIGTRKN